MRVPILNRIVHGWQFRGWPTSPVALRYMQSSYSQFGEDIVLHGLLGNRCERGIYVDVGCFHPIRLSNTYRFYLKKWSGICIDPNPDPNLSREWKRHRPRDRFLNLAVGEQPGTVLYKVDSKRPQENRIIAAPVDGSADVIEVPSMRLEQILSEHMPTGAGIDLLSVDCEGHDLAVLRSNNFARFRPTCLVVESHSSPEADPVLSFVEDLGYRLVGLCGYSRIYQLK